MNDFGKENGAGAGRRKDAESNDLGMGFYGYSVEDAKPEELEPLNKPDSNKEEEEKMDNEKKDLSNGHDLTNGNNNKSPDDDKDKDFDKDGMGNGKPDGNGKWVRKACEDFEHILDIVGGEGKYQKMLVYAVLCPIVTVSPFLILNIIFMWDVPDHWCHVPGWNNETTDLEEWKNLTLPWEKGPDGLMRHSQCKMIDQETGNETKCQFGWEYDTTDYSSTIPSEYDWVCDRDYYATDCFTWGNIGSAIGTVIFGIMADKYGRKPVFFLACATSLVFKTVSLFLAKYYLVYKSFQLFGGFAYPAVFSMPALISAEVSGTDYRSWIYAVTWMIWVIGNSLIPFVAMACRGWFLFGCIAALPGFFLFLYYPIIDESPRWLITVGKTKRATKIILKIAKMNNRQVDPDEIARMVDELVKKQAKETESQNVGVWTLFSKFRIAKNTIMLITAWTMNMLLYYGVTLNTTHMAGNKFINYFILALIELPGGWLAGKLAETTGRRWTQGGFFLLCTLSCLVCAIAVAYPGSGAIVIIGALGIKFGVAITSLVVYLQGTEIFPTQLRSTGSGLASTVASVIGVFGPYIVYSGTVHVSFPYALLFICSLIGLISAICLPETFKQNLPETIEDANNFGKGHKFWSYLPAAAEKSTGMDGGLQLQKRGSKASR